MPDFADRLVEDLHELVGDYGLDIEAAAKLIRECCVDKALHDVCMGVIHESSHPPELEEFVDPVAQMTASPEFEKEVDALYAAERKPRERKHVQFHSPYEDPEDAS